MNVPHLLPLLSEAFVRLRKLRSRDDKLRSGAANPKQGRIYLPFAVSFSYSFLLILAAIKQSETSVAGTGSVLRLIYFRVITLIRVSNIVIIIANLKFRRLKFPPAEKLKPALSDTNAD